MTPPQEFLKTLRHHEGVRQRPYLCPAAIWTVGVGRVLYQDQIALPMVRKEGYGGLIRKEFPLKPADNRVWSLEEIDKLLAEDLQYFAKGVTRLLNGKHSDDQLWACVSYSFNAGLGAFQRSTMRQKHLRGDYEGAASDWLTSRVTGGGKTLPGLVKRRKDEAELYLRGLGLSQESP